jgi:hypothetical protein
MPQLGKHKKFKVQSSKFKVQGSRFKVQGSRFKVQMSWSAGQQGRKLRNEIMVHLNALIQSAQYNRLSLHLSSPFSFSIFHFQFPVSLYPYILYPCIPILHSLNVYMLVHVVQYCRKLLRVPSCAVLLQSIWHDLRAYKAWQKQLLLHARKPKF